MTLNLSYNNITLGFRHFENKSIDASFFLRILYYLNNCRWEFSKNLFSVQNMFIVPREIYIEREYEFITKQIIKLQKEFQLKKTPIQMLLRYKEQKRQLPSLFTWATLLVPLH